jgi:hypothetical protein
MFTKHRIGFIVALLCICYSLFAELDSDMSLTDGPEGSHIKKYKLSVCALFKNEARYLREWIEYHRMIGVEHFYLYNNGSRDRSLDILAPYIRQEIVTVVDWPDRIYLDEAEDKGTWALSTQMPAYEHAAKYEALGKTEWLAFIDVDEFLLPVENGTLNEILAESEMFPGIALESECYDASQVGVFPRRELLIATSELTAQPKQVVIRAIEKTIFKPDLHTTFIWPPYRCQFKDGQSARKVDRKKIRINKYVNRYNGTIHFSKIKERMHVDSRILSEHEKKEILEIGYAIEDNERPIRRFESELRKRMGFETNWKW